jgi:hypothetical protein
MQMLRKSGLVMGMALAGFAAWAGLEGVAPEVGRNGTFMAAAAATRAEVEALVRDYERVAFTGPGGRSQVPLTRSVLPARYGVITEDFMSAADRRASEHLVATVLQTLRVHAGIEVSLAHGDAMHVVTFTDARYYPELAAMLRRNFAPVAAESFIREMQATGCWEMTGTQQPNVFAFGRLYVDVGRPNELQVSCVYRGLVMHLGLQGELRGGGGAFDRSRTTRGFTARDLAIIRMHYDPRLRPGMTAAEARPLLPAIAADALAAR